MPAVATLAGLSPGNPQSMPPSSASPASRLRPYRPATFIATLVLLLGVGMASVIGVSTLRDSNLAIERSYQMLNLIEVLDHSIRVTESNARAYRLTGHAGYREQYLASLPDVQHASQGLIGFTPMASPLRDQAERLRALADLRMIEMQRLFNVQETLGRSAAQEASDPTSTLARWHEIDVLSQQMRDSERERLQSRQDGSLRLARWVIAFVVLGMLLSTFLLVTLTISLSREVRRSRRLGRESRDAFLGMQASNAQREHLSEQRHKLSRYSSLLQSCDNRNEIMQLTASTIGALVPNASGQCYVLRSSQDFHESVASFGDQIVSSADLLLSRQCWALRRGQAHYLPGGSVGMRCEHIDADADLQRTSCLCLPLVAQGTPIGLLHVSAPASGLSDDGDADIIAAVAEQLALAVANMQLREKLQVQSLRDPLTGLFNRRYLEENLARELHRCERRKLPLSVLMVDVDHFKQFNDSHGHAAGDAVLALVGRTLSEAIRQEDMGCRYGGEEFTIVLPETDAATAFARAETIRRTLETATIVHLRQTLGPVTVSIGIATYPADGTTPELLLEVADAWLYRAKAGGRNQIAPTP